jgi:hypothetical protein
MKVKFVKFAIYFWLALAIFAVAYNALQSIKDFESWGKLTDSQKREKEFGNKFKFVEFVQNNTKENENIFLLPSDSVNFYFVRYYLFPQKVYQAMSLAQLEKNPFQKAGVIATSGERVNIDNFSIGASRSGKSAFYIYKKK